MTIEARPETLIRPTRGWQPPNLRDIWRFRELLYFLAWRDVKVRYKQTALGVVWALLQPMLAMVVFSFLFGRIAQLPAEGAPYPIFVLIGLLPWNYFVAVLSQSTTSLVLGSNLITKLYFPRLIIPVSSALAALVDLFIASVLLAAMMVYHRVAISPSIAIVPFLLAVIVLVGVGFGLWLSALNVRYRDVQYAVPFLLHIWFFLTPVIYPQSLVGGGYGWLLPLNPMAGLIEGLRGAVFAELPVPWRSLAVSTAVGVMVFISGLLYFRRVERHFADII